MSVVLFVDTFNRANGAPGGNWSEQHGGGDGEVDANWQIASNLLTTSIDSNESHLVNSTSLGTANYQCEVVQVAAGLSGAGITGRYLDTNNFYMLDTFNSDVRLFKKVSGSFTSLGSFTAGTNSGTLLLSLNGTSIGGYFNGTLQISATDADLTAAGAFTVRNGFISGHTWDDYTVYGFDSFPAGYQRPVWPIVRRW